MNFEYSTKIICQLLQWGVEEFHVCAGARNIPLVEVLFHMENKKSCPHSTQFVFNHFEERSAAFYALGRIKSLKKPVAVVTTSGTAVAELLPAVMEAYYSNLPLVLLTADRPKRYRGTGAPQSCEQKNIFGLYASECIDISASEHDDFSILDTPRNKPLHINVCFDTPLQSGNIVPIAREKTYTFPSCKLDGKTTTESLSLFNSFIKGHKNLLVIVSKIEPKCSNSIVAFLQKLNAPVYLESISNLREHPHLNEIKILCADKIWEHSKSSRYTINAILKIGGTPTHRIWRDLDEKFHHIPVFSISDNNFRGNPNAFHCSVDMEPFFSQMSSLGEKLSSRGLTAGSSTQDSSPEQKEFLKKDHICHQALLSLFHKYPDSEQSLVHFLSCKIPNQSRIFLGNSLPIRHWDFAANYEQKHFLVDAARGLNGIDGQLSTFFGYADEQTSNWAIFGDLTTLYDLSAPWVLQHRSKLSTNIVIINNGGGKIFQNVVKGKSSHFVQNRHEIQFYHWAHMWNLGYTKYDCNFTSAKLTVGSNPNQIFEFVPNQHQTECLTNEFANFKF